jgi:hypothetical protein
VHKVGWILEVWFLSNYTTSALVSGAPVIRKCQATGAYKNRQIYRPTLYASWHFHFGSLVRGPDVSRPFPSQSAFPPIPWAHNVLLSVWT